MCLKMIAGGMVWLGLTGLAFRYRSPACACLGMLVLCAIAAGGIRSTWEG